MAGGGEGLRLSAATVGFDGAMVTNVTAAGITVSTEVSLSAPSVAVMVAVPRCTRCATLFAGSLLTVATAWSEDDQTTWFVKSAVVPSL